MTTEKRDAITKHILTSEAAIAQFTLEIQDAGPTHTAEAKAVCFAALQRAYAEYDQTMGGK